jgi:DNA-binding response OmpR family regulator
VFVRYALLFLGHNRVVSENNNLLLTILSQNTDYEFMEASTKVLIIDDDVDMTDVLRLILENAGFSVEASNSSEQGVEMARRAYFDVILLDLLMPVMDGWQVCKTIRKFSHVPILILSVFNKPGMLEQALDAGADDYLVKPVPSGVLVAHIRGLTRRARAEIRSASIQAHLGA